MRIAERSAVLLAAIVACSSPDDGRGVNPSTGSSTASGAMTSTSTTSTSGAGMGSMGGASTSGSGGATSTGGATSAGGTTLGGAAGIGTGGQSIDASADGGASSLDVAAPPIDAGLDASGGDDVPIGPPPDFGPNVLIFDPSMPMATIQAQVNAIRDKQIGYPQHEFADTRYAYFFKPGQYQVDVWVEYYMTVHGLGQSPDDVTITGAVRSKPDNGTIALVNFWRAAENFAVVPTVDGNVAVWAVSQGTSLRRAHVKGPMRLWDQSWSSGGFIADSKIDGAVDDGTQQQFFTRNSTFSSWQDGNYNHYALVFVGDTTAPAMNWPTVSYSVVDKTPVIAEKPFLYIDKDGNYFVRVPAPQTDSQGPSWSAGGLPPGRSITTGRFYVAKPDADTSTTLNAALAQGKHLLFTPGVYHLSSSLNVARAGTVVMGLGLATLIADQGAPVFRVADVDGVRIASLLLQAGAVNSDALLEVGPAGSNAPHTVDPTVLSDVSCRVGGGAAGRATACFVINSSDVIGDNLWAWRADHGNGVGWTANPSKNGLVVNGNGVTIYGLFVEHFQDYQTLWNGNGGRLYFYQSELPYDPPNQAAWQRGTVKGYPSYKVADAVTSHQGLGFGVYSVFSNQVSCDNAIEASTASGVQMHHMTTATFAGTAGTQILHIFNGTGDYVGPGHTPSYSAN